jgi:hypothetical protein
MPGTCDFCGNESKSMNIFTSDIRGVCSGYCQSPACSAKLQKLLEAKRQEWVKEKAEAKAAAYASSPSSAIIQLQKELDEERRKNAALSSQLQQQEKLDRKERELSTKEDSLNRKASQLKSKEEDLERKISEFEALMKPKPPLDNESVVLPAGKPFGGAASVPVVIPGGTPFGAEKKEVPHSAVVFRK